MSKQKKTYKSSSTKLAEPKIENEFQKPRKAGIIPILILAALSVALYINTLRNNYALDDSMVLIRNSFTQQGVAGIGDIFKYDTFTGFWLFNDSTKNVEEIVREKKLLTGGRYRPLSLLTFAIEVERFGKDFYDENNVYIGKGCPAINHAVNTVYYALTVILLYIILVRLFPLNDKKWWFSLPFIATLLFALHPIHTEVVANVKGRDEILTLLGSLGALWFSIKYIDTKKIYFLILSGLALLCGLFSKENAITFLAIIPLTLYYFTNAKWKEIGRVMIPIAIASIAFLVIRGQVLGWTHSEEPTKELMNNPFINMSFSERYGTIFVTMLMYIKLLFFPHPLTYDYYPWQIPKTQLTDGLALLSLAIYIALGIYAIYGMIKKKNIPSYAILFFLIALSPVCNIFFCVGTLMNERFIFISSIGFCLLIAWFLTTALTKWLNNDMMSHYITAVVMLIVICLCSLKTISRNNDWENDTVLFTHDVEISAMSAKGNCAAGGRCLEKAQSNKIKDNNKELHDALCNDAIKYLKKSNEIYASDGTHKSKKHSSGAVYSDAMNLLGNAYFEIGNIADALSSYLAIISKYPQHDIANRNIRIVMNQTPIMLRNNLTTSTVPEILDVMGNLINTMPDCGEAYHLLGVLYGRELGNMAASLQCFEKAETCTFDKSATYYKDLGVAYGISGNYLKSIPALEKAIEMDPDDYLSYINLGYTYINLGQSAKGNEYIEIGERIKQENPDEETK